MYDRQRGYHDDRRRYDAGPPPRSYPPARPHPAPDPYYPPRDTREDYRDYPRGRGPPPPGPPRDPYPAAPAAYARDERYSEYPRDAYYDRERDRARAWEDYYAQTGADSEPMRGAYAEERRRGGRYEDFRDRDYRDNRRPQHPASGDDRGWNRRPSHSPPDRRRGGRRSPFKESRFRRRSPSPPSPAPRRLSPPPADIRRSRDRSPSQSLAPPPKRPKLDDAASQGPVLSGSSRHLNDPPMNPLEDAAAQVPAIAPTTPDRKQESPSLILSPRLRRLSRDTDTNADAAIPEPKQEDAKPSILPEGSFARDKGKGKEILPDTKVVDVKSEELHAQFQTTSRSVVPLPNPSAMQPPKGPRHGILPSTSTGAQSAAPSSAMDALPTGPRTSTTQSFSSTAQPATPTGWDQHPPAGSDSLAPSPASTNPWGASNNGSWGRPLHPVYKVPYPVIPKFVPSPTPEEVAEQEAKAKGKGNAQGKGGNAQGKSADGSQETKPSETHEERRAKLREKNTSDYLSIYKATQRALHEMDLARVDMRMAEQRRMVADAQLELAKAGTLGIEYPGVSALPTAAD
ncbi:hypothetical protein PUNSTDRAFT_144295 [Punctularia strigosozonata HHB-11173 SS5]|uniref:uncharacterized protein n=1 Tax=Punctularia strigosozonata (strain HHB-11173) TaxID=741275 RepID=UPI0004418618|nr:uncharacterized protein PUNSTDRAFT_144295 [Punctularia strigosozonata HHB-11173 SS5]EIN07744.1 hypothetical protein PUNSTDRAFT_144295 [Punctularia strigosozonata HHB-11173 SS5]